MRTTELTPKACKSKTHSDTPRPSGSQLTQPIFDDALQSDAESDFLDCDDNDNTITDQNVTVEIPDGSDRTLIDLDES